MVEISQTLEQIKELTGNIIALTEAQEKKYTKTRGVELRKSLDKLSNEKVAIKKAILEYERTIGKHEAKEK